MGSCQDRSTKAGLPSPQRATWFQSHLCTFRDRAGTIATQHSQVNFISVESTVTMMAVTFEVRPGQEEKRGLMELPPLPLCKSLPGRHASAAMPSHTLQSFPHPKMASLLQCQAFLRVLLFTVIAPVTNSRDPQTANFDFR